MISNLLSRIIAIFGSVIAVFTIGSFLGKKSQENKQIEESFNEAIKSKKRQQNRKSDDVAVVKRRMQKYVRK